MNIGENIKKFRKLEGLTQKQLGELIGKSTITIRKYEANDVQVSMEVLHDISKVLNTPMVMFLNNEADKHGYSPEHTTIKSFASKPEYFEFIQNKINEYGLIDFTYEAIVNLLFYIKQYDIAENLDDETYKYLLGKVCDLLEFEVYKLKKEGE